MKRALKWLAIIALLWGADFTLTNWVDPYFTRIVCLVGISMVMGLSLNLIMGQTGQFSLGQAGFMAVGAYVSAFTTGLLLGKLPDPIVFSISLLTGGAVAAIVAFLVGTPVLRLQGDYLAVATLGFGEIVRIVLFNTNAMGGARGYSNIPEWSHFFWIFLVVLLSLSLIKNLVGSVKGLSFLAVREDELASQSLGIHAARIKIIAFALSAFIAGVGGGLFAHLQTYIHPNSFNFLKSVEIVVFVVLGGMGSLTGTLLAATILTILPEALRAFSEWRMILYSLLLIIMMIVRPQGLLGYKEWGFLRKKI